MRRHRLVDARGKLRTLQRPRQHRLVQVMPPPPAIARVQAQVPRREHVLPPEFPCRLGILARQRMRQPHLARAPPEIALVQDVYALHLRLQRRHQRRRQHGPAILAALALPHRDLVAGEIHVLHPQADAFHQPHPGAVQQPRQHRHAPLHVGQQCPHFGLRKDRGNAPRPLGAHHVVHPGQLHAQHVAIEEQDGRQGLVLGAGRHVPLHRQTGQERLDVRRPQLTGMTCPIGQDEPPYPSQIRPLGTQAVVTDPQTPDNVLQQAPTYPTLARLRYRPDLRLIFHDRRIPCE